ncbi:arsenite efflux transporter metallochaperone ArsD [Secundilactobacillus malefermentans]|uniref:Arsenical resistance operon trans-acting repressor ArsD n=1 Tax=Secundilactobacillus malefermentans TaxID=176292 RepID=A0A4R5NL96_9LACO|nr:arsenite efflux transporter metallochaperone ArsD [Secundilactobacillus malefermentans]KRM59547.1 hypothetical protein FD44_GL001486 [Secundilactobacillus malefermentans DSM 5705 = KCTC 3548]QEA31841.1 arsenite efflux transporter metallochaperone ArsD [Secundilactobacillus malefermentans]TDG75452.1 hypothetical protein C5L31_000326 [Secundilactobacillus malefermentans]
MKKIELFEPAMCCATGVCGPSVNQDLLRITSAFEALNEDAGIEARRYNLSQNPKIFTQRPEILAEIQINADSALPITEIDGEIVKTGSYPTTAELSDYTGLAFTSTNRG